MFLTYCELNSEIKMRKNLLQHNYKVFKYFLLLQGQSEVVTLLAVSNFNSHLAAASPDSPAAQRSRRR